MTRILCQEAYVIHAKKYRETSLLMTAFFKDWGKINLIAKGVRTPRSPYKALLQPFVPLLISFQGKSDLKLLTHCELNGDWVQLSGSYIMFGLYLNELLYHLLPPSLGQPGLFDIYQKTLLVFQKKENYLSALRIFEKHLLEELGYALLLSHDLDNKPIDPEAFYIYLPQSGPKRVLESQENRQSLFLGKTLLDLAHDDLSDPVSCAQARFILRPFIEQLMEGKPIQARALWI